MNRFQLAILIDWSGEELKARKRLQKVVYLLQAAGCPLDSDFILHHYGPYSHDLAQLTDEMVQCDLLKETPAPNAMIGQSYSYKLSPETRQQLLTLKATPKGRQLAEQLSGYESLAKRLLESPLPALELASTIAYFKEQGEDWPNAVISAADFKHRLPDSPAMKDAEKLAREVVKG